MPQTKPQNYKLGDRVMRKSSRNEDEGIVKRVTPTHVDVYWFGSQYASTIRKDRIKPVQQQRTSQEVPNVQ